MENDNFSLLRILGHMYAARDQASQILQTRLSMADVLRQLVIDSQDFECLATLAGNGGSQEVSEHLRCGPVGWLERMTQVFCSFIHLNLRMRQA